MAGLTFVPDSTQTTPSGAPAGEGLKFVPDSAGTQAMLGGIAKGVKDQGRATSDMLMTGSGQHHAPVQKLERLPFTHQAILATMDNPEERRSFLEQTYGQGSVSQDKHGLVIKGKDGKMYRGSSSFAANLVAEAPETVLGIAGAAEGGAAGAIAGPAGAFVGAVGGAMAGAAAGKTVKEGAKAATGNYHKTPGQYAKGIAGAAEAGAEGEMGARGVAKVASRLTRGPLPRFITGSTNETEAMTQRTMAGGARPPPQSTMPDAKKIQRIAIIADKLSGPSQGINRANKGYLQDRAHAILNQTGLARQVSAATLKSMEGADSAISTQQTGQMIQNAAKTQLFSTQGAARIKGMKAEAYMKTLAANSRSPEDAYNWLVHGGQTDRLDKFFKLVGPTSPVTQAVQQQALRHVFAGAMVEAGENTGMRGLSDILGQYTEKQQKLLFPNGLDADLKMLDKEIKFLYPGVKDPSMAGMTSGAMMQKKFYERWYHQTVGALYRGVLQQPSVIRRLAIGFRGTSAQRTAAKAGLKEMFYFGAVEASEPQTKEAPQQ